MPLPPPSFRRGAMPSPTDKATEERILALWPWTEKLFSLRTTRSPAFRFQPGQFVRIGIASGSGIGPASGSSGGVVWRPYSMVSAHYDDYLEFFSIVVPDGAFTTRLAQARVGDTLYVEKATYGYLTTGRFVGGKDLWLLASGTGVAPFISILRDPDVWAQYENLVLAYSVRELRDLAYRDEIEAFGRDELFASYGRTFHFVPIVTRQAVPGLLEERLTELLRNGALERHIGLPIDAERARILICGNPHMLDDVRDVLQARGLRTDRSREPGHFASENFW